MNPSPVTPNGFAGDFRDSREFSDENLFSLLEPGCLSIKPALIAFENNDIESARALIVEHFQTRDNPKIAVFRTDPDQQDWGDLTVRIRADAMSRDDYYRKDGTLDTLRDGDGAVHWSPQGKGGQVYGRQGALATLARAWDMAAAAGESEAGRRYAETLVRWFRGREAADPFILSESFHPEAALEFGESHGSSQLTSCYRIFNVGSVLASGLFRTSGALPDDFVFELVKWMAFRMHNHARFIGSSWRADNHHLMMRGVSLYWLGVHFPEFRRAREMEEYGRDAILRHFDYNVFDDFTGSEHSLMYSYRCLVRYCLAESVAEDNGRELLGQRRRRKLTGWLRALASIVAPDGRLPDVGDGKAPALARIISQAASMFAEPMVKGIATALGISANVNPAYRPRWDGAASVKPSRLAEYYHQGGYLAMRDDWSRDAVYLHVSANNTGLYNVHTHWDIFDITLCVGQRRIIGSPTCRSYGKPKGLLRGFYYSMDAHNTLVIDDDSIKSHRALAPYSAWGLQPPRVSEARVCLNSAPDFEFASLTHRAYEPLIHRRDILFLRGRYVITTDCVTMDFSRLNAIFGDAGDLRPHTYRQRLFFETAVSIAPNRKEDVVIAEVEKDKAGVVVAPEPFEGLSVSTGANEYFASLDDPRFQDYAMADIFRETIGPCMFSTVYVPFRDAEPPKVKVIPLTPKAGPYRDDEYHAVLVETGDTRDIWFIQQNLDRPLIRVVEQGELKLETDAAAAFVSLRNEEVVSAFRIGGTFLVVNGENIDAPGYHLERRI